MLGMALIPLLRSKETDLYNRLLSQRNFMEKLIAAIKSEKISLKPTEDSGWKALQAMKEKWKQYRLHLERWERDWKELSIFYGYSKELRRLTYTTNPVEALHRQMRKMTKTTSIFPHDESLKKLERRAYQGG